MAIAEDVRVRYFESVVTILFGGDGTSLSEPAARFWCHSAVRPNTSCPFQQKTAGSKGEFWYDEF